MKIKKLFRLLICMVLIVPMMVLVGCNQEKDPGNGGGGELTALSMSVTLDEDATSGFDIEGKTITTTYDAFGTSYWAINENYFDVVLSLSDGTTYEVHTQNTQHTDNYTLTMTPAVTDLTKPVPAGEYELKFAWGRIQRHIYLGCRKI